MWVRTSLCFCIMLLAGTACAQTGTPRQAGSNDRVDAPPAMASSSGYRADRLLPGTAGSTNSPFHFKQPAGYRPADKPPPQANDKATVMGQQRLWQNGRPPVDCTLEPREPTCR